MSPKIVDKEAKKQELLHAAMQVFSQKGVTKTKMIDIARSAGIGKGTIYEYFRSKEEIFAAGFTHFFEAVEQMTAAALRESDNPEIQLTNFIRISLSGIYESHGDFIGIMMDFWAEGIRTKDERIMNVIDLPKIYREYRIMIAQIIDNGIAQGLFRPIDSSAYASFLIGSLDGLILQWIMEPGLFDIDGVADALCDGMLNGIRK